jgi:enoyl-CoA hydratase/carnithine racemase
MTLDGPDNPIRYEVSGGIALIRMARPPVNALDLHMVRAVIAAFRRAADDDAVRAVVLASAVA